MEALTASGRTGVPGSLPPLKGRGWQSGLVQIGLFLLGLSALVFIPVLPPGLAGIPVYGPFFCIAVAVALAIPFNRGRAVLAACGLAFVYSLHLARAFAAPNAFLIAAVLLPVDIAIIAAFRERGALSRHTLRRALVLAAQVGVGAWLVSRGLWEGFLGHLPIAWTASTHALPPFVLGAVAVAGLVAAVVVWVRRTAVDTALCAAVVASATGFWMVDVPYGLPVLLATAALGIAIGVLQDAHRFAFFDELTGLPSRRALDERLQALGDRFAIAMVDVDHFKRVNDDHGHDTGDQVLRMLAAHLSNIGGGARAYRYGGEEFAVVFPGRSAREALPHLETLRIAVADYMLQLRADSATATAAANTPSRSRRRAGDGLRVTISIGVAERDSRHARPDNVLRAADQALYRAKARGRNRISR
jgi:diguanylate cyclase (GGDEF)-like protein